MTYQTELKIKGLGNTVVVESKEVSEEELNAAMFGQGEVPETAAYSRAKSGNIVREAFVWIDGPYTYIRSYQHTEA